MLSKPIPEGTKPLRKSIKRTLDENIFLVSALAHI